MKTIKLIIASITCCLTLIGCGNKVSPSAPAPTAWKNHKVLKPKIKTHQFDFSNTVKISQTPLKHPSEPNQQVLLKPMITYSTMNGVFHLNWQGYQNHEKLNQVFATFDYQLEEGFTFSESTSILNGNTWEETYQSEPKVFMKRNLNTLTEPMGEMLGDPRKYFIFPGSTLSLEPHGLPAFKEGELLSKSAYMKNSADIGQYFFEGIPIEELAYRLFVMLPPVLEKNKMNWKEQSQRVLFEIDGKKQGLQVNYKFERQNDSEATIVFKANQSFQKGTLIQTKKIVQGWSHQLNGSAKINTNTGLCQSISIIDVVSWVSFVPYNKGSGKAKHQLIRTNVLNEFKAKKI